jgi:valyl-tRNA synthetase
MSAEFILNLGGTTDASSALSESLRRTFLFVFVKKSGGNNMQKHYDYKTIEKNIQQLWSDEKTYNYSKDPDKPLYSIDTPPPTVNGSLHIGHIFSYVQAEMIARYRRMQGYNIFYPFGFDDNGLPTERLVEKALGVRASEMPRSTFSKHCLSTTENYEKEFKDLWQSLGFSCDWNLQYETIGPLAQRISQRSFIELYKKGKAYIKESPVLWCTTCQTSIAQAELETIEKETRFYNIKFGLKGSNPSEHLLIATTRPELLNGCVSLFVHPEDERYKEIIGKEAIVPLYDYAIPILAESTVSMDKGTGIVMCATFGDATDVEWVQAHDLPYRRVIEQNGLITDEDPIIGGMHINKARKHIIKVLVDEGCIAEEKEIEHLVAVHERCGTHVEIMPSRQWYIDILTDKERFIEAADEINWYPEHMKNRYLSWVENLKWDWCISRQRFFGVPIPVWYCEQCGAIHVAEESACKST